ncbi:MAG: hypothetical protein L0I76_03045 [Pseudonocardia sp.]|nr:hypothetical protein [Pseudonocardia sp.]
MTSNRRVLVLALSGVLLIVLATVVIVSRMPSWEASGPYATTSSLPPGSPLPDDEECAAQVKRSTWEPRPENFRANHTTPPGPVVSRSWGTPAAEKLNERVTGNFVGTTDEIIQWASCKWGFDADVTRAQAVQESYWLQSTRGDGGVSYGLLQIKSTYWAGTMPYSEASTAYNVDWSLGLRRACFEGFLYDGRGRGDLWGCIGVHFSGLWQSESARSYVKLVKRHLAHREWLGWPSGGSGDLPGP